MNVDLVITNKGIACLLCSGERFPAPPQAVRFFHEYRQLAVYFDDKDCDGYLLPQTLDAPEYDAYFSGLKQFLVGRIENDDIVEEYEVPFFLHGGR